VLLAMGFVGPEPGLLDELALERDARGNVATSGYATRTPGLFAAGDARRGQSLVVWAIEEGRRCAAAVDAWLRDEAGARSPRRRRVVESARPL
jgi:glutamate synthase (NADPH/NADH) small chain